MLPQPTRFPEEPVFFSPSSSPPLLHNSRNTTFTEMILLGNLAVRMGRSLDVDPDTGAILNVDVPEEYVRPTYREGWSL